MSTSNISFKPVGVIHTEHADPAKTPVQPVFAQDCTGAVEVFPEFADGLKDIEGFSHLYLIYHLHQAAYQKLIVKPFLQDIEHGIFATRAPYRPNAIGLSIVELLERRGNKLLIKGVDILDGTPLLDIKPYSSTFDHIRAKRSGWLDEVDEATVIQRGVRGYEGNVR
jgi:tRNA (adenine37-N6)-methyltransferase